MLTTSNLVCGLVVPIPTFPPPVANQAPWLLVKDVEEAYGKLKRSSVSFQEKLVLSWDMRPLEPAKRTEPEVNWERYALFEM